MAVTASSFIVRFPEFEGEDSARITLLITEAQLIVGSTTKWGALYDSAVNFVTAHQLARGNEAATAGTNGKASGPLTRLDVENQYSKTYANPQQSSSQSKDSEYESTIYGQQFLALKKRVAGAYQVGIV